MVASIRFPVENRVSSDWKPCADQWFLPGSVGYRSGIPATFPGKTDPIAGDCAGRPLADLVATLFHSMRLIRQAFSRISVISV